MKNEPLYQIIMKELTEKIEKRYWKVGEAISTEAELERQYGVSNITVRRALNELENQGLIYRVKGRGSFVCEPPATPVRGGAATSSKVISLIVPFASSIGVAIHVLEGLTECINGSGYVINVINSQSSTAREREMLLTSMKESAGIILYPITTQSNVDVLCYMAANHYPFVVIDTNYGHFPFCCVESDNRHGGYSITEYLIHKGHQNVAFLNHTPIEYNSSMANRFMGYAMALADNGIEMDMQQIITDYNAIARDNCPRAYRELMETHGLLDSWEEFYKIVMERLLEQGATAVVCTHDGLAADIIKIAAIMGVAVPGKLSVVGFDNHSYAEHLSVPLTTVNQNLREIGFMAGKVLKKCLNEQENVQEDLIRIPTSIVERSSVRDLTGLSAFER